MFNIIKGIVAMVIIILLFIKIRGYVLAPFKAKIKQKLKPYYTGDKVDNPTVVAAPAPSFDWSKFKDNFTITKEEGKHWAKTISPFINWRIWTILLIIFGCFYGYGYWKGQANQVATLDLRGKETHIKLNEHYLHIKTDGTADVVDEDKTTVLKEIKVKDIPSLREALKPYGLICKPFFSYGMSLQETEVKQDVGLGITWLKYYKWGISNWVSNNGVWLGVNYKVTKNFNALIGTGKRYNGGSILGIVGKFNFN